MVLLNIIERRSAFVKNIYDINMPKQNQKIKITDNLNEDAIISVTQQAQKLILKDTGLTQIVTHVCKINNFSSYYEILILH